MILQWKKLYNENRLNMQPNRKSGMEVDTYFRKKYDCNAINDKVFQEIVVENILTNDFYKERLKDGRMLVVRTYAVQDATVGIDIETGFFHVESENLTLVAQIWDDLFLFRGLDEKDLENYFLVAQYLQLAKP